MDPVVEGVLGLDVGSVGVSLFGEVTEVLDSAVGSFALSPFLPKTPVAKRIPTTAPTATRAATAHAHARPLLRDRSGWNGFGA